MKPFYTGIRCPLFDNTTCGVRSESIRLDVVAATDVSEQSTAMDLCAFSILVQDVSRVCVADIKRFTSTFLIGFRGSERECAFLEIADVDGDDFANPQ